MVRSETSSRQEQRSTETKTKIIEAAIDLFAEQGYDATSVQQIVDRAGVTKGALYHHFTAKEEILYRLYGEHFADDLAELERILASGDDPERKLRAVIRAIVVSTAVAGKASAIFAREVNRLDPRRYADLQTQWRRYQDTVRGLIASAQLAGVFGVRTSPQIVSWAIFGVTNSMPTWFRPDGPKSAEEIARELGDLVIYGLQPEGPGTSAHTAQIA
jgi:AcrR family transcriptional regulator